MTQDIEKAIEVLKAGGVILYPTDTVWGIGCDATNERAIAKVYEIKQRVEKQSLIILLENMNKIKSYVNTVPEIALDIVDMATKPITIIYPNAVNLPPNLVAEDNTIAIRVTEDKFCQRLIQKFKKPIVSTSANVSNEKTPKKFSEITNEITENVDYIVNHKQKEDTNIKKASSIIKIGINSEVEIIRQ